MFGFGKHKKLAKSIDSFMSAWDTVQALDARLAGLGDPPTFRMAYFGILWGVADATAQLQGLDMETTAKGLKHYLSQLSDGERHFALVVAAPRNPELLPWVSLAGSAVHLIAKGQDPMQALLPLAEKYRLGKA